MRSNTYDRYETKSNKMLLHITRTYFMKENILLVARINKNEQKHLNHFFSIITISICFNLQCEKLRICLHYYDIPHKHNINNDNSNELFMVFIINLEFKEILNLIYST